MEAHANLELDRPRSATELVRVALGLYGRYPWLFPTLAAGVVIPYVVIVLLLTGYGPLTYNGESFLVSNVLLVAQTILVGPLISALHVHAVSDVRDGKEPRLIDIGRRGLVALPLVSVVVVLTTVATVAGYVALIVPGILLTLRWSVVAQSAALEGGGWRDPMRRSRELTHDNYLHIIGVGLLAGLVVGVPAFFIAIPFRHSDTTVLSFLLGTAVQIVERSFSALAAAVLFFELKARLRVEASESNLPAPPTYLPPVPPVHAAEPAGHPADPESYTDEDRPPGWYIEPSSPNRMRYWAADGTPRWGERKARTPRKVRKDWEEWRYLGEGRR